MNPAALVKGPAIISVDLPPAALASPAAGVASALSKRLLRWCPDLGGVLLSYGSVELVGSHSGKGEGRKGKEAEETERNSSSAEISDYFGFVRVAAAVGDALVFAPTPGMRLEGTVARVGGDYVGVLALGVFSAAVGGAALSGRFDLEEVEVEEEEAAEEAAAGEEQQEEEVAGAAAAAAKRAKTTTTKKKKKSAVTRKKAWVCRADRSHRLVEGARVLFDVARVRRSDGGFVSILGSLESASSGAVGARGVCGAAAAAAAAAPAASSLPASAPSAKKGKSSKSSSTAPAPAAAAAANGTSSKRKKAGAGGSAEKKDKDPKKKDKEPKAKKAKKK